MLRSFLKQIFNKLELEYFASHKTKLMPCLDWCNESFFEFLSKNDIKQDYLKLIKGLDKLSILTISLVINRIRKYKDSKTTWFYLTENENKELKIIKAEVHDSVVKLNYNTWSYQNYLLPVSYFEPSIFYYEHYLYEFNKIESDKCIIDAGGYVGDSALILSQYTNDKVYVFEPMNEPYELMQRTVKLNNLTNVVTENFGLGDKEHSPKLFVGNKGSSSVKSTGENSAMTYEAKFRTLDSYVKERNLKVGLIKTDVEGAEQLLLAGAKSTIVEQTPNLLISIYHGASDFFHIKPLLDSWNLGYRFKIRKPATQDTSGEIVLIAEVV